MPFASAVFCRYGLLIRVFVAVLVVAGGVTFRANDALSLNWMDGFMDCPGQWVQRGIGSMCLCPNGSYGNYVGGRVVCPAGNQRPTQPAPVQSSRPPSECPNGASKVNGTCVPRDAVVCSGGSFCPKGMMCKPNGGCFLNDDTATMIDDLKKKIEGDPAEKRRQMDELERVQKKLEDGYSHDDVALQKQQEQVLGAENTGGATNASAIQNSPEMERLNKALSSAKQDLTRVRDGLQNAGGSDAAVQSAQQQLNDSAALRELDAALPPAKQHLEGMLPPPAVQRSATTPTTAVQGQMPAPAASNTGPPSVVGGSGSGSSATVTSFPPRNTPTPQAASAGASTAGYPANATGDVAPSAGRQTSTSIVQDWVDGRPLDPMKLPPDQRQKYYERKAQQEREDAAAARAGELEAERAYQTTFGRAARFNETPEPAAQPQDEWNASLKKVEEEKKEKTVFGLKQMPDWWQSQLDENADNVTKPFQ